MEKVRKCFVTALAAVLSLPWATSLAGLARANAAEVTGAPPGVAQGISPGKGLSFKPADGVYEGVALSEDGRSLALLRTDGAESAAIDWADLDKGAAPHELCHLASDPAPLDAFVIVGPDTFAVVRQGDGTNGRSLTVVGKDGKVRWGAQGLWQIGWPSERGGTAPGTHAAVNLVTRTSRGGWTIVSRDPLTGKVLAKPRTYEPDDKGLLPGSGFRPVAFFSGYSRLLAEKPGAYDKAKDVREPSLAVVLDSFTGKVVGQEAITDRFGWALTNELRAGAARPGASMFLRLAEGGDPTTPAFELVDERGLIHPVVLPGNPRVYDRQSLVVGDHDAPGRLTFSLLIDPVNPDAVARKKADAPFLDVFELHTDNLPTGRSPEPPTAARPALAAVPSLRPALRAHVPVTDRPVVWTRRQDTLAILTRFKSFARGGDRVDVLRLAP
jgi:hypothetical protein